LSGGYLTFVLSQDGNVNGSQICAGIKVTVNLDGYGAIIAGQFIWGNDQMLPVNSYYTVTGYASNGQQSWGPNNQQVIGSGGTFDVGTWIPNLVISWAPPLQPLGIEVNGTFTASQFLLNFVDTPTVVFSNPSVGVVTATAIIPPPPPPPPASLPQPDVARYALWESGPTSWLVFQDSPTGGGSGGSISYNNPTATQGFYAKMSTNVFNSSSYQFESGQTLFYSGRKITYKTKGEASDTYIPTIIWAGITANIVSNTAQAEIPTADTITFLKSSLGPNWLCISSDASAVFTTVDSGIPCDTVNHKLEIDYTPGVSAKFKIDGTVVATITTNLPATNVLMGHYASIGNTSFVVGSFSFEYFYMDNVA